MTALPPFHLAFPVTSLAQARAFYGDLLGCPEGRSSESWVDFDFHGHQIVAHLAPEEARAAARRRRAAGRGRPAARVHICRAIGASRATLDVGRGLAA
jgi:extradiol dioxygenase family protein